MLEKEIRDKIKGCLFGGAIGDALGYPIEFNTHAEIVNKYGSQGIYQYDLNYPWLNESIQEAQVSDDSQMTFYTAEAILKDQFQFFLLHSMVLTLIWV